MNEALAALERFLKFFYDLRDYLRPAIKFLFRTKERKPGELKERIEAKKEALLDKRDDFFARYFSFELFGEDILTKANLISLTRLPFGLALVYMIRYEVFRPVVLVVFIIAALTDLIDGLVASEEGPTKFGGIIDAFADKGLFVACFFAFYDVVNPAVFFSLLAAEGTLVTAPVWSWLMIKFGWLKKQPSEVDLKSNVFGKAKFLNECIAIGLLLVGPAGFTVAMVVLGMVAVTALFYFFSRVSVLIQTGGASGSVCIVYLLWRFGLGTATDVIFFVAFILALLSIWRKIGTWFSEEKN